MKIKSQNRPTAYGIGLIALDLVVSAHPDQPIQNWAGGTCGNVLTILSYLGWDTYPIARLNGDAASIRVKEDMKRWGVKLDYAEQTPTSCTPIIVQKNSHDKSGHPIHKFSWHCPNCGAWLPNYKAVTLAPAKSLVNRIYSPSVFFFDRVSPAALVIAKKCRQLGALVFFEPSGKCDTKQLTQALELSHVVKYSHERIGSLERYIDSTSNIHLEIKTLGPEGLRFRMHSLGNKSKEWIDLNAPAVESVVDACGCGDWTTAGIISKICDQRGVSSLYSKSLAQIIDALNYGQTLAAWNCSFEGARGGMYRVNRVEFNKIIEKIAKSKCHIPSVKSKHTNDKADILNICPSCNL